MQRASEPWPRDVRTLAPTDPAVHAARTMQTLDVGAIPVCSGGKLVGMVNDRDLVLRAVAQDKAWRNERSQRRTCPARLSRVDQSGRAAFA